MGSIGADVPTFFSWVSDILMAGVVVRDLDVISALVDVVGIDTASLYEDGIAAHKATLVGSDDDAILQIVAVKTKPAVVVIKRVVIVIVLYSYLSRFSTMRT